MEENELIANTYPLRFPQQLLCERDVLSKEACDSFVNLYDTHLGLSSQVDYCGNHVLHYWDLQSFPLEQSRLNIAFAAVEARLPWASRFARPYLESLFIAMLPPGGYHPLHSDSEKEEGGLWVPNHTPQRHYSALLYLNSEFKGGTLCFEQPAIRIEPQSGVLVGFPSHHGFIHSVEPVSEGRRYSLAFWFTFDKRFALPLNEVNTPTALKDSLMQITDEQIVTEMKGRASHHQ